MKIVHNVETNEIFEENLTKNELAQNEIDKRTIENRLSSQSKEQNEIFERKIQLLNKLGITEEEAKLLLS